MIFNLFRRREADAAEALYREIVARARQPAFYRDLAVPDTAEGRFEMILLHLALVFHRLKSEDKQTARFGQGVLDAFFRDMDRSLREMGIGDLSVPKKMKKLSYAYNGRSLAYDRGLDDGDPHLLAAAVRRNALGVEAGKETPAEIDAAERIGAYMLKTRDLLAAEPVALVIAGAFQTADLVDAASPSPKETDHDSD
ncbi:MAG: ubiquinol-cytochrome C chaperone family protein [Ancalomicrobiaceae bacterium]|nr:ubiquinol-cytochrome C chaperone family protein [Ancalomicrobiaceae bacterium]